VAEHTGLIRTLSRYVIRDVVDQGSRWRRQGYVLRLSLNLSPRNLIEADLPAELARCLRTAGLPPDALQLEMTETTVMSDPMHTIEVLRRFRATGVGIAIDDFGTGHSSLSYLTRLPATELKIDKSFVSAMSTDPASRTVVRSIIDLGRNLGLEVLAEGIESIDTAEELRLMGCHLGQGYLFSRPLPAADFQRWMERHGVGSIRATDAGLYSPLTGVGTRSGLGVVEPS
jgi:EAL domain-containing protein (putative c-di-GMP-specific phosphodiesterase class I)